MKNILYRVALVLFLGGLSGCATMYPLPDKDVSAKIICGHKKCVPGADGVPKELKKNPFPISIKDVETPLDAASQAVGYVYSPGIDVWLGTPFACEPNGVNHPFSKDDITEVQSEGGRTFTYSESEKIDIDVNAAVETDLESLKAAGVIAKGVDLDAMKAKLTAAYSSASQSSAKVTGKYHEFSFTGDAYRNVFGRGKFSECHDQIDSGKLIITAVGLVWFNYEFDSNSAIETLTEVETELQSKGIKFSGSASLRREVNKSLSAKTTGGMIVISLRLANETNFF